LASNNKKERRKERSSLGLLLDLILSFIIVFIIIIGIAVPSTRVFHNGSMKRRVDGGLGVHKTHGGVHLALTFLELIKPMTHL
jgi:hypothetical protein